MFEKISDPQDVILWQDRIPIRHRYTPGVAGEAFFTALRDRGELLASRCEECQMTYCPARLFCERCFAGPLEADIDVGPQGTLVSFSVGTVGVEEEWLEKPVTVGLIRPDGADTVLMHFVIDAPELEAGMRVEAVLRPEAERIGSILDIQGFRPAS